MLSRSWCTAIWLNGVQKILFTDTRGTEIASDSGCIDGQWVLRPVSQVGTTFLSFRPPGFNFRKFAFQDRKLACCDLLEEQ